MTTMYKILRADGRCLHGGKGQWSLPHGKRPGRWMPVIDEPHLCKRGYHLVPASQVLDWTTSTCVVFEAEGRGAREYSRSKSAYTQARLIRVAMDGCALRLYSCDCAERVLPIYERAYPGDDRPRRAIDTARRYARGEATEQEMAAAWAAAGDAAWAAARDAAWAAARAAAGDAARDASRAGAWAAARDAAMAAAMAAARAAAGDAAWAAARAAARAAEERWQSRRLLHYLKGGNR